MDTATYRAKMESMGIQRGALAEGFPVDDGTCTLAQRQPSLVNRRASIKVNGAALGLPVEDLSGLNPQNSANIARGVSERAAQRRLATKSKGATG